MIINIDKGNAIFKNHKYLADISMFSVIELIKQNPMLLISDESEFIVAMASEKLPVWIWTSNNISQHNTKMLCNDFISRFQNAHHIKFAAKPIIANELINCFPDKNNFKIKINTKLCLECKQITPPKNNAEICRPDINDIEQIANCIAAYEDECNNKQIPLENLMKIAEKSINNPNFSVIKENDKIICMGKSAKETKVNKSVEGIYTIPEFRNRGYAAAIVATISKIIIEQGKTAVLFTDIDNQASNKSYKNVGFFECGRLDDVEVYKV